MALNVLAIACLIWSGVSLGGHLIAAPAKFQVVDLTLPVALQVGRAQFTWLGYAEWLLLALAAGAALLSGSKLGFALAIPGIMFLSQKFWLMPLLNARSDIIIAGASPEASNLHLVFVLFELAKFLGLLGLGLTITLASP